jgi:perosamine synthetase
MRQGMMADRIPVSGPWITEREVEYVADAVRSAWYANHLVYHSKFERAFAEYLGVQHTMALPSCTSAIHLALAALGVGPGDEVIVPDVTWIASVAPVTYVGATPVFADIDPVNWCIDPASVEALLTPRTRAIIAVELYGSMPDWDALLDLSERHGIPIIEDAAEAVGSRHNGRPAGSLGRISVFSFHGSKTLTNER